MKRKEFLDKSRRLTIKEISVKLSEERKELFTLNQEKVLGKLKDVAKIGRAKRDIARLATLLDEKVSESVKEL